MFYSSETDLDWYSYPPRWDNNLTSALVSCHAYQQECEIYQNLTLLTLNKLRRHTSTNFQPIRLLDQGFWQKLTYLMTNSADPDQLASSEANWSGSTLFAKTGHVVFSKRRVKIQSESDMIRINRKGRGSVYDFWKIPIQYLIFTTLWAYSADDK